MEEIRAENYEMLRNFPASSLARLRLHLPDLDVASFRISDGSPYAAGNVAEIRWRQEKGISVIAIRRGERTLLNPGVRFIP